MAFWNALFETKEKGKGKNANDYLVGSADGINRALGASNSVSGGKQPMSAAGPWDAEQAVKRGYENVIWIFRAVDAIASNQASLPILLRKGIDRSEGEIVEDERLFRLLNFRTNTYESSWQFRYRLSTQLLLSRRGAFIEIVKGKDGRPSELHLLPVGKTKPIPDPQTFLSGYEVTGADNKTTTLKTEDVIWMRLKPHPVDPYAQMTPLVAAGIEADTDFLARVFNRNFLAADGRPGMLLTVDPGEQPMSPEDAELLKQRFNGGPALAGQTTVIEGRGISAQDLGGTPRDVQWAELLNASKERLLMAFGTPETVMGNASGRTFDNADAERENWWLDTMMSHCNNIAFGFDALTGDINDDTVFGYDFDKVDVLQRVAATRRDEYRGEVTQGLRTIDDYFKAAGMSEWSQPETQVLFLPNGLIVGKGPEGQKQADALMQKVMQMQGGGAPGGGGGGSGAEMAANALSGAMSGMQKAQRKWGNDIAARAAALSGKNYVPERLEAKPMQRERQITTRAKVKQALESDSSDEHKALEGFVRGALQSWDNRQSEVIPERLMHSKARKNTRHWEGGTEFTKAIDPAYVLDTDNWSRELHAVIEGQVRSSVARVANQSINTITSNGVLLDMIDSGEVLGRGRGMQKVYGSPEAADEVKERVVETVMDVVDAAIANHANRIDATIRKMDAEGKSLAEIKKHVKGMIGNRGTWRNILATNVATQTVEAAQKAVYDQTGGRMVPIWVAHKDERTRPTHRSASGSTPDSSGMFRVGAASLAYPGDPSGPPAETINCRCYLQWAKSKKLRG